MKIESRTLFHILLASLVFYYFYLNSRVDLIFINFVQSFFYQFNFHECHFLNGILFSVIAAFFQREFEYPFYLLIYLPLFIQFLPRNVSSYHILILSLTLIVIFSLLQSSNPNLMILFIYSCLFQQFGRAINLEAGEISISLFYLGYGCLLLLDETTTIFSNSSHSQNDFQYYKLPSTFSSLLIDELLVMNIVCVGFFSLSLFAITSHFFSHYLSPYLSSLFFPSKSIFFNPFFLTLFFASIFFLPLTFHFISLLLTRQQQQQQQISSQTPHPLIWLLRLIIYPYSIDLDSILLSFSLSLFSSSPASFSSIFSSFSSDFSFSSSIFSSFLSSSFLSSSSFSLLSLPPCLLMCIYWISLLLLSFSLTHYHPLSSLSSFSSSPSSSSSFLISISSYFSFISIPSYFSFISIPSSSSLTLPQIRKLFHFQSIFLFSPIFILALPSLPLSLLSSLSLSSEFTSPSSSASSSTSSPVSSPSLMNSFSHYDSSSCFSSSYFRLSLIFLSLSLGVAGCLFLLFEILISSALDSLSFPFSHEPTPSSSLFSPSSPSSSSSSTLTSSSLSSSSLFSSSSSTFSSDSLMIYIIFYQFRSFILWIGENLNEFVDEKEKRQIPPINIIMNNNNNNHRNMSEKKEEEEQEQQDKENDAKELIMKEMKIIIEEEQSNKGETKNSEKETEKEVERKKEKEKENNDEIKIGTKKTTENEKHKLMSQNNRKKEKKEKKEKKRKGFILSHLDLLLGISSSLWITSLIYSSFLESFLSSSFMSSSSSSSTSSSSSASHFSSSQSLLLSKALSQLSHPSQLSQLSQSLFILLFGLLFSLIHSGWICVGIGDAMGAWVGSQPGKMRRKWIDSFEIIITTSSSSSFSSISTSSSSSSSSTPITTPITTTTAASSSSPSSFFSFQLPLFISSSSFFIFLINFYSTSSSSLLIKNPRKEEEDIQKEENENIDDKKENKKKEANNQIKSQESPSTNHKNNPHHLDLPLPSPPSFIFHVIPHDSSRSLEGSFATFLSMLITLLIIYPISLYCLYSNNLLSLFFSQLPTTTTTTTTATTTFLNHFHIINDTFNNSTSSSSFPIFSSLFLQNFSSQLFLFILIPSLLFTTLIEAFTKENDNLVMPFMMIISILITFHLTFLS